MTSHETSTLPAGRAGEPLVEMRDIVKKYGDTVVLDGVDLHVDRGEVVVLIGPSGAGKSTLLRCINGLERIQSGTIRFAGEDLVYQEKHLNQVRSRIGMVFQSFNLFPHLKVIDNLTMAQVDVLGRSKDEARARAEQLLERVGLPGQGGRLPGQALRRPAAAGGDRPCPRHGSRGDALRRAHLGARPGAGGGGAAGDAHPGRRRDDDGGRDPRDAIRPAGG